MEPLYFGACEEVDTYFREGREHFNDIYVKKFAQVSAWWTRVTEQTWPLNSGTTQKGFRFGRGFFDPTQPWRKVRSERCTQNSCDSAPERVMRPGTDSYTWDLLRKEMETEWFCVEDLMYRLLPVDEVEHIQATLAIITRTVHEEFNRTHFIGAANHKWGVLVNADGDQCNDADDTFFVMNEFPDATDEGGFDSRYIYVKCAAADLSNIACLSLDLLDQALVDLGDEEENYRLDLRENGIEKLDIIVPDEYTSRQMFFQAKQSNGYWNASTPEFDQQLSILRLGVNRVIGDYAIGYDKMALRYNADTAYNDGLGAFDANDPTTWPRLVRVPRYTQVPAEIGYKYIPNPDFKRSDFGISVAWMPNALVKWRNPSWNGTGQVQMDSKNYAGEWDWRRPDWECNRKRKQGFFENEFRLGMQIPDPTIMHVFLHRIHYSRNYSPAPCPIKTYVPAAPLDTYVCQGAGNNDLLAQ
jgi:hypothetical protein